MDREPDGVAPVRELPEDGRATAVAGNRAVVDVDRPVLRRRERRLGDQRVVERDRNVGAGEYSARLRPVERRHADDVYAEPVDVRLLVLCVKTAQRETDGNRGRADSPQLAQPCAHSRPGAHVQQQRGNADVLPLEKPRRDPARIPRHHDDVHCERK